MIEMIINQAYLFSFGLFGCDCGYFKNTENEARQCIANFQVFLKLIVRGSRPEDKLCELC